MTITNENITNGWTELYLHHLDHVSFQTKIGAPINPQWTPQTYCTIVFKLAFLLAVNNVLKFVFLHLTTGSRELKHITENVIS